MTQKALWELLWDYDPNGLIVLDEDFTIKIVNPAFCAMFGVQAEALIGQPASLLFDDLSDFQAVKDQDGSPKGKEVEFARYGLYVRTVFFAVKDEGVIACIMVNLTNEHRRQAELLQTKQETILQVNKVIDKQMSIAQEIASLLGETTAEAKVSLIKIRNMLNEELK